MFLDRQFQMPGTVFQVGTLEVAKERDANLIVMGVRRACLVIILRLVA